MKKIEKKNINKNYSALVEDRTQDARISFFFNCFQVTLDADVFLFDLSVDADVLLFDLLIDMLRRHM
jgi:hypothetical protein